MIQSVYNTLGKLFLNSRESIVFIIDIINVRNAVLEKITYPFDYHLLSPINESSFEEQLLAERHYLRTGETSTARVAVTPVYSFLIKTLYVRRAVNRQPGFCSGHSLSGAAIEPIAHTTKIRKRMNQKAQKQ